MRKLEVNKIVAAMKAASKVTKPVAKTPFNPVIKPTHRERDMRQEARDMGSHGAEEFFGEPKIERDI
jgi:hypothetical protein